MSDPDKFKEPTDLEKKWPPQRNFEYLRTLVNEAEQAAELKQADKLAIKLAELDGAIAGARSWPWYSDEFGGPEE